MPWITPKEFRRKYNITSQHLYQLKKTNKITIKPYMNGISYLILDGHDEFDTEHIALYCRVSTNKQLKDLDNQEQYLRQYAVSKGYNPEYVFRDIASGMNESRKGLQDLIELVINHKITKVFITHKDRLTRFGFQYLESVFKKFNVDIEIINLDSEKSFQEELSEDLIAIIHYFSMRFYGKRKNRLKQLEETLKADKENEDK